MCLGVPFKVLGVDSSQQKLLIAAYNEQRTVSSMLLGEEIAIGDYVIVQVGGFACERLSAEQALECLALLDKIDMVSHDNI